MTDDTYKPTVEKMDSLLLNEFKHLGHGLYLVPRKFLKVADKIVPKDSEIQKGEFVFENPRLGLGFRDSFKPEGMQKEEIDALREAIKNDGLDHPLLCRPKDGCLQIINGMRRLLQIDYFVKNDVSVKDKSTGQMVSAKKLFGDAGIPCLIEEMSDFEAYRRANNTDDTSKPHGDAARLAQLRYFAKTGVVSDTEIAKIVGKSKDWVARMKQISLKLDKGTFDAFAAGAITFTAAEWLSEYKDPNKRNEVLKDLLKKSKERNEEMVEKAKAHVNYTVGQLVKAQAAAVVAKQNGDPDKQSKAEEQVAAAEKNLVEAQDAVVAVRKKKTPVARRDLPRASNPRAGGAVKANDDVPAGIVNKLTPAKQTKHWYEPACAIIKARKKNNPEGNIDNKVHDEFYYVVKLLHEKFLEGETDLDKIGKLWTKQAERRGSISLLEAEEAEAKT